MVTYKELKTMPRKKELSRGVILVTGAAGYVGSHTLIELLNSNYEVVCLDNCCNAVINDDQMPESLKRVELITGKKILYFSKIDLLNEVGLDNLFRTYSFDGVIHFAGLKAVGESCQIPLTYYKSNVNGTLNLLITMQKYNVKKIIFSSSCTVYGNPAYLPVNEEHSTGQNITNPYGRTKFVIEEIMKDNSKADLKFGVVSLRYFNPIGAHESGLIGEDPQGIPNNLMPFIAQVAVGRMSHLKIFGSDFDTIDGTGVRDYIHVMDLAKGHLLALDKMLKDDLIGFHAINLGTGKGYSVLELVKAFEKANNLTIPYEIVGRRPGDIACVYANAVKASEILNWEAEKSVLEMCKDQWNWQSNNPYGFKSEKNSIELNNNQTAICCPNNEACNKVVTK